MPIFNRAQLRRIFTPVGPHVGDDVADVLEEGVGNLVPKSDIESLREDIRTMFAAHESRLEAKLYRAIFALAVFFLALYGATVGFLVAFLG